MEISILTDVGQRRTNNQDYANQYKNKAGKSMVFLADGMGGGIVLVILLARWLLPISALLG